MRSLTVNLYEDAHAVADSVLHNQNFNINYLKFFSSQLNISNLI